MPKKTKPKLTHKEILKYLEFLPPTKKTISNETKYTNHSTKRS